MPIETLEDWNARLSAFTGGCCTMPSCPVPTKECQSLDGTASITGYAPFVSPEGEPTDKLPAIYETLTHGTTTLYSGSSSHYETLGESPITSEALVKGSFNLLGVYVYATQTYNSWDETDESCSSGAFPFDLAPQPADVVFGEPVTTDTCAATVFTHEVKSTSSGGTDYALEGCPGPFDAGLFEYWDFADTTTDTDTLSAPTTEEALIQDAIDDITDEWPETPEGADCDSATLSTWPTIADIGEWPACPDGPPAATAEITVTKTRYRWVVPEGDENWDGSYFKVTWDVLTEPEDWDAETNTPARSYVQDLTWEWLGGSRTSEWFELSPPPVAGTRRVVNVRFICYRSPYGSKPQLTGEGVDLSEDSPLQARFTTDRHSIRISPLL